MSIFKQRQQALEVSRELREEADGSRDAFYEKYGSSIHSSLSPIADAIEALVDTDLESGLNLAQSIGEYYFPVDTSKYDGAIAVFHSEKTEELTKWLQSPEGVFQASEEIRFENRTGNEVVLVVSTRDNEKQTVQLGLNEQEYFQTWLLDFNGTCDLGSRLKMEQNRRGYIVVIVEAFKTT